MVKQRAEALHLFCAQVELHLGRWALGEATAAGTRGLQRLQAACQALKAGKGVCALVQHLLR